MKTININGIDIDIHNGSLGISVSGGADSAILLYAVMKYAPGPIHVYTCASREKHCISPHIALNVINKCIDLTNRLDVSHHVFFVEQQTYETLFKPLSDAVNNNSVDYMYTAVTALPPAADLSYFITPTPLADKRDPTIIKPVYNGKNSKFYSPFFNINKKEICKLYEELGVKEELFPVTRSCEDPILTEGHCGKCWWCEERKWGFGQLV